jgi:REP element-mobilizing transposase RayT
MPHRSHTKLFYHFVWATLNREKKIDASWEDCLYSFIKNKSLSIRSPLLEINGTEDHIHVLLRGNSSLSPAQIGHDIKGASSHMVNTSSLTKSHFDWQDGYGAISVSPDDIEKVSKYIRNQKQHHSNGKVNDEWEKTDEFI